MTPSANGVAYAAATHSANSSLQKKSKLCARAVTKVPYKSMYG